MNSVKTVATVALFLGVVYGVYQVINNQGAYIEDDSPIVDASGQQLVSGLGVEIDPENMTDEELELALFGDGSEFETDNSSDDSFNMDFGDLSDDGDSTDMTFDVDSEESETDETVGYDSFSFDGSTAENVDAAAKAFGLPAPNETAKQAVEQAQEFAAETTENVKEQFNQAAGNVVSEGRAVIENSFAEKTEQTKEKIGNSSFGKGLDAVKQFANAATSEPAQTASTTDGDMFSNAADTFRQQADQAMQKAQEKPAETAVAAAAGALNSMFSRPKKEVPPASNSPTASAPEATPGPQSPSVDLTAALERARIMIEKKQFREALTMLSAYDGDRRLNSEEQNKLNKWLDPLAGKVIYSAEHHVTQAHVVRPGDTLEKIATAYNVSPQLIYNINRSSIPNPNLLTPGSGLKVVEGPFNAQLNRSTSQLTLYLGQMYAGRFVVSLGSDAPNSTGRYTLSQKSDQGHDYLDVTGKMITSSDPTNPYGRYWLGLDNGVAIHSTAERGDLEDSRGCISLSPIDAEDVYGILTAGSQVMIR